MLQKVAETTKDKTVSAKIGNHMKNPPATEYANVMAEAAEIIAEDDSHGYSQDWRNGNGDTVSVPTSAGNLTMHDGEYDCSSLVEEVTAAVGLTEGGTNMTTYTEEETLENAGFTRIEYNPDKVQRGDILLRHDDGTTTEHTAIAVGNGQQVDASHGDSKDGRNGIPGDQDGTEILKRDLQDDWQIIYRPPKGQVDVSQAIADGAKQGAEETEKTVKNNQSASANNTRSTDFDMSM